MSPCTAHPFLAGAYVCIQCGHGLQYGYMVSCACRPALQEGNSVTYRPCCMYACFLPDTEWAIMLQQAAKLVVA